MVYESSWVLVQCFLIRNFLHNKWFLDFIQNNYVGIYVLKHSYETAYKVIDKGLLEILFVNSFSHNAANLGRMIAIKQTGSLYVFISLIIISAIYIISLIIFLT